MFFWLRVFIFWLRVLIFFLIISSVTVCDIFKRPHQLRGTGFSVEGKSLVWTLNVGVLYDSDFYEPDAESLKLFLQNNFVLLNEFLPGLKIRYVMDQPLNSVFIMQRVIRRQNFLIPKLEPQGAVLLLDGSAASLEINRRKMERYGYNAAVVEKELKHLKYLAGLPLAPGKAYLDEKLPASDYVWRLYMEQQVRYDLILTNGFIYPDDLRARNVIHDSLGGVLWRLAATEGRSGSEGYGALVSLNRALDHKLLGRKNRSGRPAGQDWTLFAPMKKGAKDTKGAKDIKDPKEIKDTIEQALKAALLALIFPTTVQRLQENRHLLSGSSSGNSFLQQAEEQGCHNCRAHWRGRLNYLKAIYRLHKGYSDACRHLKANFRQYRQIPERSLFYPGRRRAEIFAKNQENFQTHCRQKS